MNDISYIEPLSDSDFTELLIRHMILSPEVYAKSSHLSIIGDDMMIDDTYGSELYRELINIANSAKDRPISATLLFNGLKARFENGTLDDSLKSNTLEFIQYVYDDNRPLEKPEFFDKKLSEFIRKRRAGKLIAKHKDDVTTLTAELNKLTFDTSGESEMSSPRFVNPFVQVICKTKNAMIGSGITRLDSKLDGGLRLGEYAQLIGFSGGGKTAVGINMIGMSAEAGTPATYISCEEHEADISQRCYSRVFRIPYKHLRSGSSNLELEMKFSEEMYTKKKEMLAANLGIIGLKGVSHAITPNYLYELLNQEYEKTGFIPKIVMLDQLQFVEPDDKIPKSASKWDIEGMTANELDLLSHRAIGGKYFVLWVQHQAKGKTKAYFNREEIQGLKAIINSADLTLGVGRANEQINQINLFPLKIRHSAQFNISLQTEFEYMTVSSTEVSDTLPDQESTTENPTMTHVSHTIIPTNPFN